MYQVCRDHIAEDFVSILFVQMTHRSYASPHSRQIHQHDPLVSVHVHSTLFHIMPAIEAHAV